MERKYYAIAAIVAHVWPKAIVVNSVFVKFQQYCVAILTDVITVIITALVITYCRYNRCYTRK